MSDRSASDGGAYPAEREPQMEGGVGRGGGGVAATAVAAHTAKRQEAAALLALWSALVLTEGTVRFILSNPAQELLPSDRPTEVLPPILPFLASLMECIFGLSGVIVGCGAAFFNAHSRMVTLAFLVTQTVQSWFVFVIYVFLIPSYRARYLEAPIFPFDSVGGSRWFIAMGILTSIALCLALQGGQFAFGMRLLAHQSPPGKASARDAAMAAVRGVFWNGNMVLGGLSTTIAGGLLLGAANGGSGRLGPAFFGAPPHVGVFPLMTLFTGLSMTATGLAGMVASAVSSAFKPFLALTVVNYLLAYLNFTIVQVGAIEGGGPPQAGAFHSGLVLLTALIGPYFAYRARNESPPACSKPRRVMAVAR
ncbi:hypothetical protein I4F81_009055 [Pyropia yezoensis]|uniref:Uncharacterized protein n=1 Tax=Pyropia yezoensis TaxID=2788 RepID=A0ACC3C8C8_PYRYE|nr:hypothetical protein I4F81_009055 [Neopyropia yezoensis]